MASTDEAHGKSYHFEGMNISGSSRAHIGNVFSMSAGRVGTTL